MSHGHFYAISPVIHNDSFEKVDFSINLHGDYKSCEPFEFFWNLWNFKFYENFEIMNFKKENLILEFLNFLNFFKFYEI